MLSAECGAALQGQSRHTLRTEGGRHSARHEPMQAEDKDVPGQEEHRAQGSGFCQGWARRRVGERLGARGESCCFKSHTRTHAHNFTLSWFLKIYTLGDFIGKNIFFEKSSTLNSFAKEKKPEHVVTLAVFPPGYRQQGPSCSGALPESLRGVMRQWPPCPVNDRHGQDPAGG